MKGSIKNKKNMYYLSAILIAASIVLILAFTVAGKKAGAPVLENGNDSDDVTVEIISPEQIETGEVLGIDTVVEDALTIADPVIVTPDTDNEEKEEASPADLPIEPYKPTEDSGKVIIGNTEEPYDCGYANHHCEGPETHAFVLNLELEGCPFCKSHSCRSFYAVDQWGYTCYDPSKCPSYDIHLDPVYYCQVCGNPCGDGQNGTCVRYVDECVCPHCGVRVPSWTCHTCK